MTVDFLEEETQHLQLLVSPNVHIISGVFPVVIEIDLPIQFINVRGRFSVPSTYPNDAPSFEVPTLSFPVQSELNTFISTTVPPLLGEPMLVILCYKIREFLDSLKVPLLEDQSSLTIAHDRTTTNSDHITMKKARQQQERILPPRNPTPTSVVTSSSAVDTCATPFSYNSFSPDLQHFISHYRTCFEEISVLGEGGFGRVVKVRNLLDGKTYAVKQVLISDSNTMAECIQESVALSTISSPFVVQYYHTWKESIDKLDSSTVQALELIRSSSSPMASPTPTLQQQQLAEQFHLRSPSNLDLQRSVSILSSRCSGFGDGSVSLSAEVEQTDTETDEQWDMNSFIVFDSESRDQSIKMSPSQSGKNNLDESDQDSFIVFQSHSPDQSVESSDSESGKSSVDDVDDDSFIVFKSHSPDQSVESSDSPSGKSSVDDVDDDSFIVFQSHSPDQSIKSSPSRSARHSFDDIDEDSIISCDQCQPLVHTSPLASISTPTTTDLEQFDEHQQTVLLIQMEYCTDTLKDAIERQFVHKSFFSSDTKFRLFKELILGLVDIHSHSMIHRDLKPANIFLQATESEEGKRRGSITELLPNDNIGVIKIGDFGLTISSVNHTGTTVAAGTSLYMAPELRAQEELISTSKVDIYSAGLIVFEIFYPCVTASERIRLLSKIYENDLPPQLVSEYPTVSQMIRRMTHVDPSQRPSAQEIFSECFNKIPIPSILEQLTQLKDLAVWQEVHSIFLKQCSRTLVTQDKDLSFFKNVGEYLKGFTSVLELLGSHHFPLPIPETESSASSGGQHLAFITGSKNSQFKYLSYLVNIAHDFTSCDSLFETFKLMSNGEQNFYLCHTKSFFHFNSDFDKILNFIAFLKSVYTLLYEETGFLREPPTIYFSCSLFPSLPSGACLDTSYKTYLLNYKGSPTKPEDHENIEFFYKLASEIGLATNLKLQPFLKIHGSSDCCISCLGCLNGALFEKDNSFVFGLELDVNKFASLLNFASPSLSSPFAVVLRSEYSNYGLVPAQMEVAKSIRMVGLTCVSPLVYKESDYSDVRLIAKVTSDKLSTDSIKLMIKSSKRKLNGFQNLN
ncbi:hypothetical protein GEMRC1_002834 [Eukaryota sp. GEM-RC1]